MTATQVCSLAGAVLVLAGTAVAIEALVRERKAHAIAGRLTTWIRSLWRRLRRKPVETHSGHLELSSSANLSVDAHVRMDGTEPLERLGPWMVERMEELRIAIGDAREGALRSTQEVRRQVETVERALDEQRSSARDRVAVSSSRQMWSLVLIGAGTMITLVPGVLGI